MAYNTKYIAAAFFAACLALVGLSNTTTAQALPDPKINANPSTTTLLTGYIQVVTVSLDEPIICPVMDSTCKVDVALTLDSGLITINVPGLTWLSHEWAQPRSFTITNISAGHSSDVVAHVAMLAESNSEYYDEFANSVTVNLPATVTTTTTFSQTPSVGFGESGSNTSASVSPGGQITVHGSGFKPNSEISATLHSSPVLLGTVTANASGTFVQKFAVPKNTSIGNHQLVVSGINSSDASVSSTLSLTVNELPATGSHTTTLIVIASAFIVLGIVLRILATKKLSGR